MTTWFFFFFSKLDASLWFFRCIYIIYCYIFLYYSLFFTSEKKDDPESNRLTWYCHGKGSNELYAHQQLSSAGGEQCERDTSETPGKHTLIIAVSASFGSDTWCPVEMLMTFLIFHWHSRLFNVFLSFTCMKQISPASSSHLSKLRFGLFGSAVARQRATSLLL